MSRLVAKGDGLWVNPEWNPGDPGFFVVIVGISEYQYLDGSEETFRMGKLKSSALTAYRIFEWFDAEREHPECKLAKVWMLLAPCAEEKAVTAFPDTPSPTLENIKQAVLSWRKEMKNLPDAAAAKSYGCFFFSGHGLEIIPENQVLLPVDYLKDTDQPDYAISTGNLRLGNADLKVDSLFLILDACRNDNDELREYLIEGQKLLTPVPKSKKFARYRCQHVYATATNLQAYQRRDPKKGFSIFGQALLEGLHGLPDMAVQELDGRRLVNFIALQSFLKRRVPALLQIISPKANQNVEVYGSYDDFKLAELIDAGGGEEDMNGLESLVGEPSDSVSIRGSIPEVVTPLETTSRSARFVHTRALTGELADRAMTDWGAGHEVLGHENVTDFAQKLVFFDLVRGRPIDRGSIRLDQVSRGGDDYHYQLDLSITSRSNGCIWVIDARNTPICALLPPDRGGNTRYRLELTFDEERRNLCEMQAGFAPVEPTSETSAFIHSAVGIWDRYQTGNRRLLPDQETDLIKIALDKVKVPLPAALALSLLVQHQMDDRVQGWPRNLARWFDWLPDGPSIWLAQALRRPESQENDAEIQEALRLIAQRGLPFFGPAFELGLASLTEIEHPQAARFKQAAGSYRSGGQFVTLSGRHAEARAKKWMETGGSNSTEPELRSAGG
jgi:hypothetical protein